MKLLFTLNIENTIDIITNSSSELFVLESSSNVDELIRSVYPNYENEYTLKTIDECDDDELGTYVDSVLKCGSWDNDFKLCDILGARADVIYDNFNEYGIKNWWYGRLSKEGKDLLLKKVPKNTYLLFSKEENPIWEYQERLQLIAYRYHLG